MPEPAPLPSEDPDEAEWIDLSRVISLSDGIFGFAMTLLTVDLVIPVAPAAVEYVNGNPAGPVNVGGLEGWLGAALQYDWGQFLGYVFAFAMIALWWLSHQRLIARVKRANRPFVSMNLFFLMAVAATPFVLRLLIQPGYSETLLGAGVFLATEAATGLLLAGMWYYATDAHRLVDPKLSDDWIRRNRQATLLRPGIFLAGLLIAFVHPTWGLYAVSLVFVVQVIQRRARPGRKKAPTPVPPALGGS